MIFTCQFKKPEEQDLTPAKVNISAYTARDAARTFVYKNFPEEKPMLHGVIVIASRSVDGKIVESREYVITREITYCAKLVQREEWS